MLKKALLKALTNLTPEEKDEVRKSLGGGQPASEENVDEHEGKGAEKNEKTVEDTKEKAADGSAGEENFEDETDAGEEDGESKANPGNETTDSNPAPAQGGKVLEVEGQGNGVRVEDLVTQDMLTARLEALNAKLNAVIDENKALKDKYENPDFGNHVKKGAGAADNPAAKKAANESFEEYSKQFM